MGQLKRAILVAAGAIALFAVFIIGLVVWSATIGRSVYEPPRTIGTRSDNHGAVQYLIRKTSYRETIMPITVCGSGKEIHDLKCEYFLQDAGNPIPDRPFMTTAGQGVIDNPYSGDLQPVAGSGRWVIAIARNGLNSPAEAEAVITVINDTGLCADRTYPMYTDGKNTKNDLWMEDGNRTVVFRTTTGFSAYDVINDSVTPRPKH